MRTETVRRYARITATTVLGVFLTAAWLEPPAWEPPEIVVYKRATCGCCNKWVDHLLQNGIRVSAHDVEDLDEIKANVGVPPALSTCHTAVVGKYVIEGHVPADVIHRLLKVKPKVLGLAVPGMPAGSPGMEGARRQPYDILTFDREGRTQVFEKR